MAEAAVVFSLREIVNALEGVSDESRYYANVNTGEIKCLIDSLYGGFDDFEEEDEELEDDCLISLPDKYDIDDWRIMRDFAWAVGGKEGDKLLDAIHGKGAFRAFRRSVENMGALNSWYAYKDKCYRELALEWLEQHGLVWKDDIPEEHKLDWCALLPAAIREKIALEVLVPAFSVCKLESLPADVTGMLEAGTCFIARTADEVSLVCETAHAPANALAREDDWRALKVSGPLDFSLVGILAKITASLAEAEIPLFAVSTYDTDYVLVKAERLDNAIAALEAADCEVAR